MDAGNLPDQPGGNFNRFDCRVNAGFTTYLWPARLFRMIPELVDPVAASGGRGKNQEGHI